MSSHWRGDNNPGHKRRMKIWAQIEDEFDEPISDVIMGLREQDGGNSWRTVAGCLDVSPQTLLEWRHALGLDVDATDQKYDPSSYKSGKPHNHLDHRAKALGYENAIDAVTEMRLKRGLTIKETAQVLGCHYQTVSLHTPDGIKGLYNRSEYWWKVRREQCRKMTAGNVARRKRYKDWNLFSRYNRLVFKKSTGD